MGETAENLVDRYAITRDEQDAFALESHHRAVAAQQAGHFDAELAPVELPTKRGVTIVDRDEGPRADTSLEKLATLAPAFRKGGSVTAGNSSSLNDGAAALVLMSARAAEAAGAAPLARYVASAAAGVSPRVMGIGPVPAVRRALEHAALSLGDIGHIELNEAFAAQSIAVLRELAPVAARVNPLGGAIALGHPLGASGARIATTLIHAMRRDDTRYGLATMCVGVGQGVAAIFERL
jgi:acetyl-CoA acetyltransferase family protein